MDEPEIVTETHLDYIKAGAQIITINAYAASPERLESYGHADLFQALQQSALDCAAKARDIAKIDVQIAGSMPPLFNSYNPDLNTDPEFAEAIYRKIANAQKTGVDILLAETLGSLLEINAALEAMQDINLPKWLSVTIDDDAPENLRSGEALSNAVSLTDQKGVDAMLLNCSTPEAITKALPIIGSNERAFGAYANGFSKVTKLQMGDIANEKIETRNDLSPEKYAEFARHWAKSGASIIGGCCETTPAHIKSLAAEFGGLN